MIGTFDRDYLSQLRKKKKLSLGELSKIAGISKTYLWELENKPKNPSACIVSRLAKSLGVTVDALIISPNSTSDVVNYPKSLVEFRAQVSSIDPLSDDDMNDLARIKLNGASPINVDDWWLVYLILSR